MEIEMSDLKKRVSDTVCRVLCIEPFGLADECRFDEDLGCDSLDAIDLLMALEDEFAVEIVDEELAKLKTVGELIAFLEREIPRQAA
jgi:acyl carrier protein